MSIPRSVFASAAARRAKWSKAPPSTIPRDLLPILLAVPRHWRKPRVRHAHGPRKNQDFHGRLASLAHLITGEIAGRTNEQEITASSGIKVGGEDSVKGLQFVTVGSLVYDRAKAAGLGQELPTELFLQDIRD